MIGGEISTRMKDMPHSIGELIRQVRRQHNITQTELGGDRYSKSYVSAVERNKIIPSQEALRYFAGQLRQSEDYFISLLEPSEQTGQLAVQDSNFQLSQDDALTLLDILLENTDLSQLTIHRDVPSLSPEMIAALPAHKQYRFYYLMGLVAREKQAWESSLKAFEYALVLAPPDQQPLILDEIGLHYATQNDHHTALVYFQRAIPLLQDDGRAVTRFKLEFHSAESYRASGNNKQALEFYELARQHQPADAGVRTAGMLYLGLGYSTYAAIQRQLMLGQEDGKRLTGEDKERAFQRALGFLIQSRTVFQVTNDSDREMQVRLTLAFILLDLCEQRKKAALEKRTRGEKFASTHCMSLLDDAEEQCRQVLFTCQSAQNNTAPGAGQRNEFVSSACAGLIQCALQRAILARLEGYKETGERALIRASYLSGQTLELLKEHAEFWTAVHTITSLKLDDLGYRTAGLPHSLPIVESLSSAWSDSISLVEVYFAVGAVCEEMGRIANALDYASDCYARATSYFQAMLAQAQRVVRNGQIDASYLTRCYTHCVALLEERAQMAPLFTEETTATMINILKHSLWT